MNSILNRLDTLIEAKKKQIYFFSADRSIDNTYDPAEDLRILEIYRNTRNLYSSIYEEGATDAES